MLRRMAVRLYDGAMTSAVAPSITPTSPRRVGRWLIIGTTVWALVLAGLGYLSYRTGPATVREQRSIGEAAPIVDRAVATLLAARPAGTRYEISEPKVSTGCRLTPFRRGAILRRDVKLFPTGPEATLITGMAQRLPAAYAPRVGLVRGVPRELDADAGEFVVITGDVTAAGEVTFQIDTGCRPAKPGLPRAPKPPTAV